jgi:putative membrane protein
MQLTDIERQHIIEAIRSAEDKTSGEIYCIIARTSGNYRSVSLAWSAVLALAVPLPLISWTAWSASVIYALQLCTFLAVLIALSRATRLWFVPSRSKRDRAHAEALKQFTARGLQNTEARTGVLIYVSIAERYAEILADAGIDEKVTADVWADAVSALTAGIKSGQPGEAFVTAIGQCATILAAHFPPGAINRNELPNDVVEI